MRARYPDNTGFVERDGVKVAFEVFGEGERTVLLMPTWSIVASRQWKLQVPHLARQARVVTFDGRGSGRSDRPGTTAAYTSAEFAADALAVLDAVGCERAVVVGVSMGAGYAIELAAMAPERVISLALIGPSVPLLDEFRERPDNDFHDRMTDTEGWALFNEHAWREQYGDFVRFFFSEVFSEPHATKPVEDCIGWAMETDPETLILIEDATYLADDRAGLDALLARVTCPSLVVHGVRDRICSIGSARALAQVIGADLLEIEGGGHLPHVKDAVRVNRVLGGFLDRTAPPAPAVTSWRRARDRRKRLLYLSSPIGLGHSRRDVAIVDELRRIDPDLQVDWLAQHPLTALLTQRGERIHPASRHLANESGHIESESAEHDLHAFQAIRRMDEILVNNFMVFADLVEEDHYDAWVGDEAWELDYFLHENPELKRTPYVWLTDFVGWLPMPDGGDDEAALTADYNAEMVEQIARYPRLRDRALFVGAPDDLVPDGLGPDLPTIRDWSREHFDFVGYVTGFDPTEVADHDAVRAELGYRPDEKVCIVTVGGSGVGVHLLQRVIAAYPLAKARVPELRMVVVSGPRIDPASLPTHPGLEVRGFVPDLYRHLAVCDLAIVQGGLTTTMELTANRRPFIYVPLRHHFEQSFHVRHRLERYGAGRRLDYDEINPEALADAIADEIGRPVDYRPVETDGARRAAERIADLL